MPNPPPPRLFSNVDDPEDRSEQLPSVEEAKIAANWGLPKATNYDLDCDADPFGDIKHSTTDSTIEDSENFESHDQLPHLDEAKLYSRTSQQRRCGTKAKVCGFFLLFLVAGAVLALALLLQPTDEDEPRFSSSASDEKYTEPPMTRITPSPTTAWKTPNPTLPSPAPVAAETAMPSEFPRDRYSQAIQLLSGGVSRLEDLVTEGSSQERAARWIADVDGLQLSLLPENKASVVQRYVIVLTYFSMGGEGWDKRLNFLTNQNECSWNLVQVDYESFGNDDKSAIQTYGVTCYRSGVVQKLHFPQESLVGSFPQELQLLTELEHLDAFHNPGLTGGFPTFLKGMPRLKYLGLHYCKIKSPLPDWLGSLSTLESLALSNNYLTGKIPESFSALTNLEDLFLDDNNLEGSFTMLSKLPNLKHLVLEDNNFSGNLDGSFFSKLNQLEVFDASSNPLKSRFPVELFGLEKLRVLDLHSCEMYGSIPPFTIQNSMSSSLELLVLSNNTFTGELPTQVGSLSSLIQIDLSRNQFVNLPATIADLPKLEYLFSAMNPLAVGQIPAWLSTMSSLKDLSLKSTNRIGPIPEWIGDLTGLKLLDLDDNALVSIPESIGKLSDLEYLLLNRNLIYGTLPADMELLSNLELLLIDKNNITGNAETVCIGSKPPKTFVSDCGGPSPSLECRCCSLCCDQNDDNCNNHVWLDDINPIWELGYVDSKRGFDAGTDQVYSIVFRGGIP